MSPPAGLCLQSLTRRLRAFLLRSSNLFSNAVGCSTVGNLLCREQRESHVLWSQTWEAALLLLVLRLPPLPPGPSGCGCSSAPDNSVLFCFCGDFVVVVLAKVKFYYRKAPCYRREGTQTGCPVGSFL